MEALEFDITTSLLRAERKRNEWLEQRDRIRDLQARERQAREREAAWVVASVSAALLTLGVVVVAWELRALFQ
jgi:hypothetical protein